MMYIKKIVLEHIKSFNQFTWQLDENEDPAGWHVLLGDNGAGKSSFIRSAALALIGKEEAYKTRLPFASWVTKGQDEGQIILDIVPDYSVDKWQEAGLFDGKTQSITAIITKSGGVDMDSQPLPKRNIWTGSSGWFAASYGPFRRFSGGNDYQELYHSAPLLARHLSVFGEDVALTATLEWLQKLRFKQLEDADSIDGKLLNNVQRFLNQPDFLPNNVKMKEVNSDGVIFIDGAGVELGIEALSDGYRAVLSMMLELIRQIVCCYQTNEVFSTDFSQIDYPGVVFVDEIDVHLHPSWQRSIGQWLTRHFPRIQFIVSTHSPLVCQGAVNGSIWQLPKPGEPDTGGRLTGVAYQRLVYGNMLEALSSGAFGEQIERSETAQEMLDELAELNYLASEGELDKTQVEQRASLQSIFGTSMNTIK